MGRGGAVVEVAGKSRFPSGRPTRKARARTKAKARAKAKAKARAKARAKADSLRE